MRRPAGAKELTSIVTDLQRVYGQAGRLGFGGDVLAREKLEVVPSGIVTLDWELFRWGGPPLGRLLEISGRPGACKSLLGYYYLREAQRLWPDRWVAVLDTEGNLNWHGKQWMEFNGVDLARAVVGDWNRLEALWAATVKFVRSGRFSVILIDSLAHTKTLAADEKGQRGQVRGGDREYGAKEPVAASARVTQEAMKDIIGACYESRTLLVIINQMRANVNVRFGRQEDTPGGAAFHHGLHMQLELSQRGDVKEADGTVSARRIEAFLRKSKVCPAGRTTSQNHVVFPLDGRQVDQWAGWMSAARRYGVLGQRGGGWYEWGEASAQGPLKFREALQAAEQEEAFVHAVIAACQGMYGAAGSSGAGGVASGGERGGKDVPGGAGAT